MNPDFLTVKQYADLIQMHEQTIFKHLLQGKVPGSFRVGSAWRIHRPTAMKMFESIMEKLVDDK
jgi:hypothetical protein